MVLIQLHAYIAKVCPIHGIAQINENEYRIDFMDEATENQKQEAYNRLANWPLEQAKLEKLAIIENEWNKTIEAGWDSGQGILGISGEDVALLNGAYSLSKEAANLGMPLPPIITLDSQEISFPDIQAMTLFMLQYGQYRSNISKVYAAKKRAVDRKSTRLNSSHT